MIILSGVTAVLCAENPMGGKRVSYLPLSCKKAHKRGAQIPTLQTHGTLFTAMSSLTRP